MKQCKYCHAWFVDGEIWVKHNCLLSEESKKKDSDPLWFIPIGPITKYDLKSKAWTISLIVGNIIGFILIALWAWYALGV